MSYSTDKINQLNDQRLAQICPIVAGKVRHIIVLAAAEGHTLLVTTGMRTFPEQTALYNQPHDGRDNDGDGRVDEKDECVTHARAGQSFHNYGLAADLGFIVDGQISWKDSLYANIGRWAKIVGLEWGGNWKSFKDLPHVQQIDGLTTARALALYNQGGLPAVWAHVGHGQPVTATPQAADPQPSSALLKLGDNNIHVREMQDKLFALGLLATVDGDFGKLTLAAVKAFQKDSGLTVDGIGGPDTLTALQKAYDNRKRT